MKTKKNFKKFAAACVLAAGVVGIPSLVSGDEIVKVIGQEGKVIGSYSASSVSYIEFGEGNIAEVSADSIVIPLSDSVKFTMIKVEGGVPYTLTNQGTPLEAEAWANGGATKIMEDFWIGKFEVTQGIWKDVMKISTDEGLPVSDSNAPQSAFGDDFPITNVSWEDICKGDACFLIKINARLKELKQTNPALAAVLGDREFRLPNEWEWEYAAAGGKNYATLEYYFSGTKENTATALQSVAVNSQWPNKAEAVAKVGSKEPNALGLYDMSGNVWERLSGLGYPGHEDAGYLENDGTWPEPYLPVRGGSWGYAGLNNFRVTYRNSFKSSTARSKGTGFRLVL